MDNLNLNDCGGITRRMTDKERIQELEKQLAESIPKSKIREIMAARSTTNFPDSRKKIINNIAKLL